MPTPRSGEIADYDGRVLLAEGARFRKIIVITFGDAGPRIIRETGARSHTELGDRSPAVRGYEEVTG